MNKPLAVTLGAALALTLAGCVANTAASPSISPVASPPASSDTAEPPTDVETPVAGGTAITLTSGDTVITATLNDTQVSQDFLAMLPVTLPWFRNSGIEYITELPAPLTEDGPFYTDVQPGDLVYYNPRDSITIIYEETSSVPTLTYMGEITSDLDAFDALPDDVEFDITLAD